jgi:hypothetical protein
MVVCTCARQTSEVFTDASSLIAQLDAKQAKRDFGLLVTLGIIQVVCVLLIMYRRKSPAVSGYALTFPNLHD